MSRKNSRPISRREKRRVNWQRAVFMILGVLVVVAFVLSMIHT